ncbi:hypothetical protein BaRGS_00002734 [Batillaria attramentaria]|uniref:OTU domain-containing protein n=1 Tax=Batillaria attramentaria TaxID=370345 RepID=A0ABD0M2T5_9CAEN
MASDDSHVYLQLAASLTAETSDDGFNTSDDEPLSKIDFNDSDMEPLKWQTGFDSSDDEPLQKKADRHDDDDVRADPSYEPSDCEQGSTEKKRKACKRKRRAIDPDLQKAKESSFQVHLTHQRNLREHTGRLDNFLSANGLYRQEIAPDGNCFFEAAVTHLEDISHIELRNCLCDYLEDNFSEFIHFMVNKSDEDENERYLRYFSNVNELRRPGRWVNDAADLLPRALADWAERTVVIYFSDVYKSQHEIHPSAGRQSQAVIPLAFIDYDPSHYDACLPIPRARADLTDPSTSLGSDARCTVSAECERTATPPNDSEHGDANGDDTTTTSDTRCTSPTSSGSIPSPGNITPRKQGLYSTPPKKKLVRHREAKPETWKKNVRKSLHLQGKEYLSQSGKKMAAKSVKRVDCSKCRYKCTDKISEEKQQQIFDAFYELNSYERQKDFVCANVTQKNTATLLDEATKQLKLKKRQVSRAFTFNIDGQIHRVCKNFFLATLALSETYVDHAMKHSCGGVFTGQQQRGKSRPPHNKYSDDAVNRAKEHIASFPVPKKDQCVTCTVFKQKGSTASEEDKLEYQQHIERKDRAREEKARDKNEASKDPKKHVVTMDLQAVLQAPCGLVSQLYYKRKLSVYNFTVYSLTDRKGTCFTWDESEGKRGSCEIATCLYIYLSSLPKDVEEVIIFSDCCAGQNRNQYLSAAMIHAVNHIGNIKVITHKYLETGHTHMECDSMHSAITFAKRHTSIYTPSEWDIVLRMARRGQPYVVIPLKHTDFLDFKSLASTAIRNTKTDLKGNKVNWLGIRSTQFLKGQEEMMFFKYSFDEQEYQVLKMIGSSKRRGPPLPSQVPRCYSGKLPISAAKKQDLLSLCQSGVIPVQHHNYYTSLLSSSTTKEKLPEPDIMEDDSSDLD